MRLRKPSVKAPKDLDTVHDYLQMPLILEAVTLYGDMFGKIPVVNFDDYDLPNEKAFPKLVPKFYLERVVYVGVVKVEPMPWACGLSNAGILNLLRIPHFGRYPIMDICVRQRLALVHDGRLRIKRKIPINAVLNHPITDLPKKGSNPMANYGKSQEMKVAVKVNKDYKVGCDTRGFLVQQLDDPTVRLGTLLLGCKMMRKCRPKVVVVHVIALAGQCKKGISFNWSQFLCSEFLENVCKA